MRDCNMNNHRWITPLALRSGRGPVGPRSKRRHQEPAGTHTTARARFAALQRCGSPAECREPTSMPRLTSPAERPSHWALEVTPTSTLSWLTLGAIRGKDNGSCTNCLLDRQLPYPTRPPSNGSTLRCLEALVHFSPPCHGQHRVQTSHRWQGVTPLHMTPIDMAVARI